MTVILGGDKSFSSLQEKFVYEHMLCCGLLSQNSKSFDVNIVASSHVKTF